jgi:FkbM family methyltransferase
VPADTGPTPPRPLWLSPALFLIRRLPAGRYWLFHRFRGYIPAPFTARLAADFGGCRFVCDPRDSVASEAAFTGRYEPQETLILSRLLRDGDVFVDAGANWGYFTLVAASLVGPHGRVLAFEPEPRMAKALAANVAMNSLACVDARPLALGAGDGSARFAAFDAAGGNWGVSRGVLPGETPDFECATRALDDVLDRDRVDRVQLVKIDVEGGEVDVLTGMRRGLSTGRYRYVLLECHPELLAARGIDARVCIDELTAAGYRAWLIDHSPRMHEITARRAVSLSELMRPYSRVEALPEWPHLLAAAPGAPDPR